MFTIGGSSGNSWGAAAEKPFFSISKDAQIDTTASSARKKAKTSSKYPDEPLECINYIRECAIKSLVNSGRKKGGHVNSDIEQNFREVRALLNINAEIFTRCMDSVAKGFTGTNATFVRSGYDVVKVRQCPTNAALTELITVQKRTQESFSMKTLSDVPADLKGLIVVNYQAAPYQAFVDYDAFFKSAVVLHDDVLEQFLVKLKQHLESIQVCLGKIESWLLEPKSNIKFLGETFGSHVRNKLENVSDVPMGDDYISSDQDPQVFAEDAFGVCPRCFCKIDAHTPVEQGHYSQCDIFGHTKTTYKFLCSDGTGYFKIGQPSCQVKRLKVYKQSGKFETEFNIANASDQKKLMKFIEFMGN
jgi:hypothetical protein